MTPDRDVVGGSSLWFDPAFGASGDMILGALADLGASINQAQGHLENLGLSGWSLQSETVTRSSISARNITVMTEEQSHHRSWSSIDALLADSALPDSVKAGSRSTFLLLGQVEAAIHAVDLDDVHFHEVGALDAIVDIVGAWLLLDQLHVKHVSVGSIGCGYGTVESAHGTLTLPAPATAAILRGVAVHPLDIEAETITPTGAALLSTMATGWGPIPAGHVVRFGRGAGQRNPTSYPNILTAALVDTQTIPMMLATNLDDISAEVAGHVVELLLEAGADDAWVTPIVMKKTRPGYELQVLASADKLAVLQHIVFTQTQTLGMRTWPITKTVLERRTVSVVVRGEPISVKVGPYGHKPEHDDLARLNKATGISLQQLAREASAAFQTLEAAPTTGTP